MSKLKLPKEKRITGLYIYCNHCKKRYSDDSAIPKECKRLVYKAKLHVPNQGKECRTTVLKATTLNAAIRELLDFEEELRETNFLRSSKSTNKESSQNVIQKEEETILDSKNLSLIEAMADYMSYINNIGVPWHEKVVRSKQQIKEYERNLKNLLSALEVKGIETKNLSFRAINNRQIVGHICEYLLVNLEYRPKTYNKSISGLSQFVNHIIEKYELDCKNCFVPVKRKKYKPKPVAVKEDEFLGVLEAISPENGKYEVKGKKSHHSNVKRTYYKPWLYDAFLLGFYTGGRREEVVKLKWSGLKYQDDELSHIDISHFKENRSHGNLLDEEDYEDKSILITDDFKELLVKLGYENKKDSDEYILAPTETMTRTGMMGFITNAFTHFYKIAHPGTKHKLFKQLRKTYLTLLQRDYPQLSFLLGGHKDPSVEIKHYRDNDLLIREARKIMKGLKEK